MILRYPAAGAAVLLALAGCSTSTTAPIPTATPSPTHSASASPSESGAHNVLPPIMVNGPETVQAKVGDTIVVPDNEGPFETDNAEVLEVVQPMSDGSAEFNGGAEVVGVGTATLIVGEGKNAFTVDVIAEAAEPSPSTSGLAQ